jgi:hypothetical protein
VSAGVLPTDRLHLVRIRAESLFEKADLRTVVADHDVVLRLGLLEKDVEGRRQVRCHVDALAPGLKLACHEV